MSVLIRPLTKQIQITRYLLFHSQFRFLARSIAGEHVKILNQDTLTGRLIDYINSRKIQCRSEEKNFILKSLSNESLSSLHKFTNEDIVGILSALDDKQTVPDDYNFVKILNVLDLECCLRLNGLSRDEVFGFLGSFLRLIPQKITNYKFYSMAVEDLSESTETLSKDHLIQLIFYVGLQKKTREAQKNLRKCLASLNKNFINNLTTEDLCIVCNSTFKTSTKITNKFFLDKVKTYINDNLFLLKDPALFVTLIKTIRHNRYQDDDLLSTTSHCIFFNKTLHLYSFTAICHILALFSDYLYYDEPLLIACANKAIDELKENRQLLSSPKENIRLKDIKRFLWALSNLNYQSLNPDFVSHVIIPLILDKLHDKSENIEPGSVMEIILYLWMMNFKAYDLIPYGLSPQSIQEIRSSKSLSRTRLNLLLSCFYFEEIELFRRFRIKAERLPYADMKAQVNKRPSLVRVMDSLKRISKSDLNKFEFSYQVPYLNIVGIVGYKNNIYKSVFIEVLDDFTCVKNKDCHPSGLMQLKLRILDQMEEAQIVVSEQDIENSTEEELQNYLLDELELVCL